VAIDAAQQGARHPEEAGVTGASTHTGRAYSTDWLTPAGPCRRSRVRPRASRARRSRSCPRLPQCQQPGVGDDDLGVGQGEARFGAEEVEAVVGHAETVTGLRSGTAPRSARPTRTAGGVVRRGAIRPGYAWRRAVGGPSGPSDPLCASGAAAAPGSSALGPRTGSGRVRRRAVASKQLGVCAALDDAPGVDHEQLVRLSHRREAVGDHERRPAGSVVRSAAWTAARTRSRGGPSPRPTRRRRGLEQQPGEGHALLLPPESGSRGRRRACRCVGERVDEGQDLGLGENGTDLLVAGVGLRVEEVRPQRVVEEVGSWRRRPRCLDAARVASRTSTPFSRTAPSFTS